MSKHTNNENLLQVQTETVRPPRVWTVFAALGLALVLSTFFQVIFGAVLAIVELNRGTNPEEMSDAVKDNLTSPYIFMLMIAAGQLAFAISGFFPAFQSRVPFRERVGLKKAHPSWQVYPMAMIGSIVPLAIGLTAAQALTNLIPEDQSLLKFFDALTIESAIVFVLFVGIVPGLVEEVLFRGYMQQRLVKRWGAVSGITITSILFGLLHVSPHAIAAVMLLGFWLGYIAWRSNSIWPSVMCHFFVNSGLNAWRMVIKFCAPSQTTQDFVHVCMIVLGLFCFAICLWPGFWRNKND